MRALLLSSAAPNALLGTPYPSRDYGSGLRFGDWIHFPNITVTDYGRGR